MESRILAIILLGTLGHLHYHVVISHHCVALCDEAIYDHYIYPYSLVQAH